MRTNTVGYWDEKKEKLLRKYKNLNDKRIKARIAAGKTGAKLYDWWEINQVKNVSKEKTEHPCQGDWPLPFSCD